MLSKNISEYFIKMDSLTVNSKQRIIILRLITEKLLLLVIDLAVKRIEKL